MDRKIVVIADNIRSSHNVGSLLRTCEGLAIDRVFLTGYTPYPAQANDKRLPHIANKINRRIIKTSLGSELTLNWEYREDLTALIDDLKSQGYFIVAVELDKSAIKLSEFKVPNKVVYIFGNERTGIETEHLKLANKIVFIPMLGRKESFNVVQSAAMVLYVSRNT